MKISEWVTLIIACIGAVLGIINTWYTLRREKVKLRVTPLHTFFGDPEKGILKLGIEVVNLSLFSITVSEVGFRYKIKGFNLLQIADYHGNSLPLRLKPRSSHTFYIDPPEDLWNDNFDNYHFAYASTACGRIFRGKRNEILTINKYEKSDFQHEDTDSV